MSRRDLYEALLLAVLGPVVLGSLKMKLTFSNMTIDKPVGLDLMRGGGTGGSLTVAPEATDSPPRDS